MAETRSFNLVIRERRRQLNLTQEQVARRIKMSTSYITFLETGRRHPSDKVVFKLASALGLNPRQLFFLAYPQTKTLISNQPNFSGVPSWNAFVADKNLRLVHNITDQEMEILSEVTKMGDVREPHDFVFILIAIRQALGR